MVNTDQQRSAVQTGLGLVSPLWPAFAFAASMGATYWWMSRFTPWRTSYVNLEAVLEAPAAVEFAPEAAEPVIEAAAEVAEAAVDRSEAVTETVVETAAEPVEAAAEAAPVLQETTEEVVLDAAKSARVSRKAAAKV